MPYCLPSDLEQLLVSYKFDDKTLALAGQCISFSEAEIEKYLSKRYDIAGLRASNPVNPTLSMLSKLLASSYLIEFSARGSNEESGKAAALRKLATTNLEMIRDYKVDLVDASGDLVTELSNTAYRVMSNTSTYSPTFNEDDPLDWEVDDTKLTDIADERS